MRKNRYCPGLSFAAVSGNRLTTFRWFVAKITNGNVKVNILAKNLTQKILNNHPEMLTAPRSPAKYTILKKCVKKIGRIVGGLEGNL